MIYWDTSYLAKLYLREAGTDEILAAFSGQTNFVCSEHGRLELMSTFKRHERAGLLTAKQSRNLWVRHGRDLADGLIQYLPVSSDLIETACTLVAALSTTVFLCAADAGLKEIYSHDRHLLAAAPHFKLKGIDVIKAP